MQTCKAAQCFYRPDWRVTTTETRDSLDASFPVKARVVGLCFGECGLRRVVWSLVLGAVGNERTAAQQAALPHVNTREGGDGVVCAIAMLVVRREYSCAVSPSN